jgi:hypothetical protein
MVLEGYMRRSTGAKQSSPSFADGDWISLATIQYGEVLGVVGVEWNSLTTTGSAHHGYTRLKIGSYYNSYYYGWETTLQMLDTQHHNGFHFSEFRIIRPDGYVNGNNLLLQGKTSTLVTAGSFQVYVESRLGPNADNITPLQPVVDNSPTGNTIQAQISTPVGTLNAISGGLSVTGATVLNEFGANQDFRVESDSKSHALFVDAGANLVMVGRDSTTETTGVYGAVINATGSTSNIRTYGDGSNHSHLQFIHNGSGAVGSITTLSTGTTYNTTSDRRLKDNIEPIADGTAKLLAMNPVTHTWKNVPDAPAVHGFIAQEMIDIVPEAVSGDPTGQEMMSMDYGRITPVLVAALQDAHKKIAELEARLNILEGK